MNSLFTPLFPAGRAGCFFGFPVLAVLLFASLCTCAGAPDTETSDDPGIRRTNIRYINLDIIFDFLINRDADAREIKRRRESLLSSIDDIEKRLEAAEGERSADIRAELQAARGSLDQLKSDEENHKEKILNEIDAAVGAVSKKDEIDFVFNIGEGTVYARREYDITEKVLNEITGRRKRGAPVSR